MVNGTSLAVLEKFGNGLQSSEYKGWDTELLNFLKYCKGTVIRVVESKDVNSLVLEPGQGIGQPAEKKGKFFERPVDYLLIQFNDNDGAEVFKYIHPRKSETTVSIHRYCSYEQSTDGKPPAQDLERALKLLGMITLGQSLQDASDELKSKIGEESAAKCGEACTDAMVRVIAYFFRDQRLLGGGDLQMPQQSITKV